MKTLMKNSLLSPWCSGLRTRAGKNGYRTGTQAGKKCFHYGTPPQHFNFKFFGPWTSMPRHFFFFFRSWFPSRLGFVEFSDDKKCFSLNWEDLLMSFWKRLLHEYSQKQFSQKKKTYFKKVELVMYLHDCFILNFQSIFSMIMCQN